MKQSAAIDVVMRPASLDDSARLLAWRNLPQIRRWMYTDHEISQAEHDAWYAKALADPSRRYWVVELDGAPVGLANLADIDATTRRATWAYYLAEERVRGRGIGAFVEYWMIEQVFTGLGLAKLWCEVLVDNEPVWKMHEKFGFVREALFRRHALKGGALVDVVGLGLLAEDWAAIRDASRERLGARGFPV
ncbi:UDP-4-amino-4,6-dideoxy-N-acetyl-beta-L-altrosamine N-acetyltransferase [Phenylobacterium sp.]|uniref:UDP-4-amino-4, 6-dideoxy-N-acetyl-beta-L-altrosamine N-acetyltransferase n=1 Tax=Phenylobacterium sp. TaxID=1871053 RepID=UPI003526782F